MTIAKRIFAVLGIILLIAVSVLTVFGGIAVSGKSKVELVKLSDIHIPENLDTDRLFGLFFFDEDGTAVPTKNGVDKVNYDPNKPTIIFVHGMQMGYGYNSYDPFVNPEGVVAEGYNFGVFIWSQLADCDLPGIGKKRIWGRNSGEFYYQDKETGERKFEQTDILTYSTAEVFVAYYLDFMEQVGCNASSITFSGHSLGANTMYAVTSYMTTLYREGLITKEFLPDRITYLDAYMDALKDEETYVAWKDMTMPEGGVIEMAKQAVDEARKLGISTEYVKSSNFVSYLCDNMSLVYGGGPGTCRSLFEKMLYLDYDASYQSLDPARHTECIIWIFNVIDREIFDSNVEGDTDFAFNFNTPVSYSYARVGAIYEMKKNKTRFNFDDDVYFTTNVETAKIAGFAFRDVNDNGINDDRLMNRVEGVKVALYDGDTLVEEVTTTEGGYYEFNLKSSDVGKEFTVKVTLDGNQTFAKYANDSDHIYMCNDVKDGTATVEIGSDYELKIINIGIK